MAFAPDEYTDPNYGYAGTLHAAQGATDHSLVWRSTHSSAQGIYVAGTRHRESLRLFHDRESFADLAAMVRSVAREPEPNLVLDHPEPSVTLDRERVLAAMGSRQATWTWRPIEALCRAQSADAGMTAEDVLKHPKIIPLEPDLMTTRRQVLVEARLLEAVERLDRRESLDVLLDLDPEADPARDWLEGHAAPDTTFRARSRLAQAPRHEAPDAAGLRRPRRRGGPGSSLRLPRRRRPRGDALLWPLAEGCTVVVRRAELLGSETLANVPECVREAWGRAIVSGDPQGHPTKIGREGDGRAAGRPYAASEWQEHLDQQPEERMAPSDPRSGRFRANLLVETAAQAYLDSRDARLLVAGRAANSFGAGTSTRATSAETTASSSAWVGQGRLFSRPRSAGRRFGCN